MSGSVLSFKRRFYLNWRRISGVRLTTAALLLAALILTNAVTSAHADSKKPIALTSAQFAKNPNQYVGKLIKVRDFACYSQDQTDRCVSPSRLDVVTSGFGPAAKADYVSTNCGAMDGIERTPGCVFVLTFTPRAASFEDGEYVENGESKSGKIWVIQTDNVEASAK